MARDNPEVFNVPPISIPAVVVDEKPVLASTLVHADCIAVVRYGGINNPKPPLFKKPDILDPA